jgi:hypothetical protein
MQDQLQPSNARDFDIDQNPHQPQAPQTSRETEKARAIAEVQSEVLSAKEFPRNEKDAKRRILRTCKRYSFAEKALYQYPRGGETISGPTVQLLKLIAQQWGNLNFGWRELERHDDYSEVVAYCWDKETNTRNRIRFTVDHYRDKRSGREQLDSERDIYEKVANYAARRMRACIEGIVPADVIEDAVKQVRYTLAEGEDEKSLDERIEDMIVAFDDFGIETEDLEDYLGHSVEKASADDIVELAGVYNALQEDPSRRDEFFDVSSTSQEAQELNERFSPDSNSNGSNGSNGTSETSNGHTNGSNGTNGDSSSNGAEPSTAESGSDSNDEPDEDEEVDWNDQRRRLGQLVGNAPVPLERETVEEAIAERHDAFDIAHVDAVDFKQEVDAIGRYGGQERADYLLKLCDLEAEELEEADSSDQQPNSSNEAADSSSEQLDSSNQQLNSSSQGADQLDDSSSEEADSSSKQLDSSQEAEERELLAADGGTTTDELDLDAFEEDSALDHFVRLARKAELEDADIREVLEVAVQQAGVESLQAMPDIQRDKLLVWIDVPTKRRMKKLESVLEVGEFETVDFE